MLGLSRRQAEILAFLRERDATEHAPTLDEVCAALGLRSRGSLHKHVRALQAAGLVRAGVNGRGLQLCDPDADPEDTLPVLGRIAAGQPIEAIDQQQHLAVPSILRGRGQSYVLQVDGDSMIDEGILDGDWVVVEHRDVARNGELVVALVDDENATLKRFQLDGVEVVLHPANAAYEPQRYPADRVQIQGVVVGQMRRY